MTATIKVGAKIEAQCGRCHDATTHKVLEVAKASAKRVQCTVCDALHLYRSPKGPEDPTAKKQPGGRKKADPAAAYAKAVEGASEGPVANYTMSGQFQEGQRLKHKVFGPGVVTRVVRPRLVEVTFEEGLRRLAMNR